MAAFAVGRVSEANERAAALATSPDPSVITE
jgi:hypothetical protein